MADQSQVPEPTELIYVPSSSWAPAFTAVGLGAVFVGAFTSVAITIVGALILLWAVLGWFRSFGDQAERLPRRQRPTSAVLPPIDVREED
jgi:hypothetical protein